MRRASAYDQRLILIRHGEAASNHAGAFLGLRDETLTAQGHKQAKALADRLELHKLDAIVSSPLRRARETAGLIAASQGLVPKTDSRLAEMDFGAWDGMNFAQVAETFPADYVGWMDKGPEFRPTNGESLGEVGARMEAWWAETRPEMEPSSTLGVVAHAGCLQALICSLMGIPLRAYWPFRIPLASWTELQFNGKYAVMIQMGMH